MAVNGVEIAVRQVWRQRDGTEVYIARKERNGYWGSVSTDEQQIEMADIDANGRSTCGGLVSPCYDLIELVKDEHGFTIWRGGEQPEETKSGRTVVRMRNGVQGKTDGPSDVRWRWYHVGGSGDIVAYKVTEERTVGMSPAHEAPYAQEAAALPADEHEALTFHSLERDPNGTHPHTPGAKLDAGKNRLGLVVGGFSRALRAVGRVGTFGAEKYTAHGWVSVPDGQERYTDAMYRHLLDEAAGEVLDPQTGIPHAAHAAWNALARLDLLLRAQEGGAA